ncbi:MAG TPA: cbb3-type cytochrome oxidase assembly protein [Thermodesulfobacteriota bacterium]|nr:cbb3-type cytochrome oxidase assembly protein [Thermodesulfobacteriota bacterium]
MRYYLPWVLLVLASVSAALAGFFWAVRNGQFSDQDRARYLPLRDLPPMGAVRKPKSILDWAVFASIVGIALVMMGVTVYIVLSTPAKT